MSTVDELQKQDSFQINEVLVDFGDGYEPIGRLIGKPSFGQKQKEPIMDNASHEAFRDLNNREKELIDKLVDRGHEIAEVYQRAQEVNSQNVQIAYSEVGNFTIATVVRTKQTIKEGLRVVGMVNGASKRHPDDDPDDIIGRNIALSRAMKGDYFKGPQAWRADVDDLFEDEENDLQF